MRRFVIGLALVGCAVSALAGAQYSRDQLRASFYYDLGPADIDVSAYPDAQKANYAVFKRVCSQCHTLARPINAPIAAKTDWRRYVERMHIHTSSRPGTAINKEDASKIVAFLAFDSKARKLGRKAEFEAQSERLRRLFEDMRREREQAQIEEGKNKANTQPLDSGAGVRPRP